MNKSLPIVIVILLLLVGGGIFLAAKNKSQTPGAATTSSNQSPSQDGNIVTSIKDALSKSLSLECTYNDDSGSETKTYIKAGAVRAESKVITQEGTETYSQVIFKDRKMYTWDTATKKGVVFEVPEETMQEAQSFEITPATGTTGDNQGESFLAEIEKYKDACKPATVSDSLFTPPTDVEFQDLSTMFQNMPTGSMPDNGVPSGFDLEQLKKQYAPEDQ